MTKTSISKERKCVITLTPDNEKNQMDAQTGDVGALEIINMLRALEKHFARELVAEARKQVGNDDAAIEKWLDMQYQKPGSN
jgi:hypothetical protein